MTIERVYNPSHILLFGIPSIILYYLGIVFIEILYFSYNYNYEQVLLLTNNCIISTTK